MNTPAVSRTVARTAARWLLRMEHGQPDSREQANLAAWRAASEEHERAWQLAQQLTLDLKALPVGLTRAALLRPATFGRRATLKSIAALIVLAGSGLGASRSREYAWLTADQRTQIGEIRSFRLPCGSELTLNTDSAVDIRYSEHERLIELRKGEVFIATAADTRPLRVISTYGTFTPQGTQFSVRQFNAYDQLQVIQGAVRAQPTAITSAGLLVNAGHQAQINHTGAVEVRPGAIIDWVTGVLRADRLGMADLLAELARYRHGWLRCAPQIADIKVSGTFQLNDTDAVLVALAATFPIRIESVTRYWVSVQPA